MNTRRLFLLAAVLLGLGTAAFAQTQSTEATVTKVTGTATVQLPDGSSQAITQGMKLPQGAVITTAAASEVTIQPHEGIVAIAGPKTTVAIEELSKGANGLRTAALGLRSGNLASSLDPSKKAVNNYAVRTPKGVAAARGTTYSVSYDGVTYSVTVVAGVVQSFTATGASVNVNVGQVTSTSDSGTTTQTLAEAIATPGSSVAEGMGRLAAAVASVSTDVTEVAAVISAIASNAGTGQAATNAVASATAAAASTAAVTVAAATGTSGVEIAQAIVNAAVTGSATAGNTAAAATIVATTTVAVVTTTGNSVANVGNALTQTANNTAGVSVNATAVVNAVTNAFNSGSATVGVTSTPVQITDQRGNTDVVEAPLVTPVQPIDPSTISRSE